MAKKKSDVLAVGAVVPDAVPTVHDVPALPVEMDKVNSLEQKELAMHSAGVKRIKAMRWLAESMLAEKEEEFKDTDGIYKKRMVPDKAQRNWAFEQITKLNGDMIERKEVAGEGSKTLIIINYGQTSDRAINV